MTRTHQPHEDFATRYGIHLSQVGRITALLNRDNLPDDPDVIRSVLTLHSKHGANLELHKAYNTFFLMAAMSRMGLHVLGLNEPAMVAPTADYGKAIFRAGMLKAPPHGQPLVTTPHLPEADSSTLPESDSVMLTSLSGELAMPVMLDGGHGGEAAGRADVSIGTVTTSWLEADAGSLPGHDALPGPDDLPGWMMIDTSVGQEPENQEGLSTSPVMTNDSSAEATSPVTNEPEGTDSGPVVRPIDPSEHGYSDAIELGQASEVDELESNHLAELTDHSAPTETSEVATVDDMTIATTDAFQDDLIQSINDPQVAAHAAAPATIPFPTEEASPVDLTGRRSLSFRAGVGTAEMAQRLGGAFEKAPVPASSLNIRPEATGSAPENPSSSVASLCRFEQLSPRAGIAQGRVEPNLVVPVTEPDGSVA